MDQFKRSSIEEELSKKSYEVVLPLVEDNPNIEIESNHKEYKTSVDDSDYSIREDVDEIVSDQDEDGVPKCNTWRGKNYKLHVLGQFDNAFQKTLRAFHVPKTVQVAIDPSGRNEFPSEYPPTEEAYLIWEGNPPKEVNYDCNCKQPQFLPKGEYKNNTENSLEVVQPLKVVGLVNALSSDDEDVNVNESNSWDDGAESDTELEISEYIKSQKFKKQQGLNLTGETFMYDDEYDVIRNLHKDSISLSNYGPLSDNKILGKTRILFDQLTTREKEMLRPVKSIKESQSLVGKGKQGNTSTLSIHGGGDSEYNLF